MLRSVLASLRRPVVVLAVALVVSLVPFPAQSQRSAEDAREQREQVRREEVAAARELDTAQADVEAVHAALVAVTASVNSQQAEIDEAERQLEIARAETEVAENAIVEADAREAALADELASMAVAGYVKGNESSSPFLQSEDLNQSLRQSELLGRANGDTTDLLEEVRQIRETRELAREDAVEALERADQIEAELRAELDTLEEEQALQAELKAEFERRVAEWESKIAELEAADAELTAFIKAEEERIAAEAAAAAAAAAAASSSSSSGGGGSTSAAPGSASGQGFQWPIQGRVSSGYGYRIHPIYGTRRLHTGIDMGAPTGTPIAAAKGGVVLSAGWRGGYGNAVVISHGDGISTLYAHQTSVNVSAGQSVSRGDIVGWVGSTGASTGPHLHFEVRVGGSPVNPRPYLP